MMIIPENPPVEEIPAIARFFIRVAREFVASSRRAPWEFRFPTLVARIPDSCVLIEAMVAIGLERNAEIEGVAWLIRETLSVIAVESEARP